MEACIVICRTYKDPSKRGKILFINALKEVTRKNAQSYLEDKHIEHISSAYENYIDEDKYAKVATIDEIAANDYSLNIALYVRDEIEAEPVLSIEESIDDWLTQQIVSNENIQKLINLLNKED